MNRETMENGLRLATERVNRSSSDATKAVEELHSFIDVPFWVLDVAIRAIVTDVIEQANQRDWLRAIDALEQESK